MASISHHSIQNITDLHHELDTILDSFFLLEQEKAPKYSEELNKMKKTIESLIPCWGEIYWNFVSTHPMDSNGAKEIFEWGNRTAKILNAIDHPHFLDSITEQAAKGEMMNRPHFDELIERIETISSPKEAS